MLVEVWCPECQKNLIIKNEAFGIKWGGLIAIGHGRHGFSGGLRSHGMLKRKLTEEWGAMHDVMIKNFPSGITLRLQCRHCNAKFSPGEVLCSCCETQIITLPALLSTGDTAWFGACPRTDCRHSGLLLSAEGASDEEAVYAEAS